jgi:CRP-like cAMP-binding protein
LQAFHDGGRGEPLQDYILAQRIEEQIFQGLTTSVIAVRLGVSRRSVVRRKADLVAKGLLAEDALELEE